MSRYHSTGRNSWIAQSGYRDRSKTWARFQRPDDQPSIALGTIIFALPILAIAGLVIAFTGV